MKRLLVQTYSTLKSEVKVVENVGIRQLHVLIYDYEIVSVQVGLVVRERIFNNPELLRAVK